METRIKTIKERNDNKFSREFASRLPYLFVLFVGGIAIFYRWEKIVGGIYGVIIIGFLLFALAILIEFIIRDNTKIRRWTDTKKVIQIKDGNEWRNIKGLKVD